MSEQPTSAEKTATIEYGVVVLMEEALTELDARQVHSLHESIDEPVRYHLLLPVTDAAAQIEAGIGTLGAGDLVAAPTIAMDPAEIAHIRAEEQQARQSDLRASIDLLAALGRETDGSCVQEEPIAALGAKVAEVDAREAIILTRPHVVSEFFHLDWTSRARRKLGVPVLHLLEHETFDEQAEGYGEEGVTGL